MLQEESLEWRVQTAFVFYEECWELLFVWWRLSTFLMFGGF